MRVRPALCASAPFSVRRADGTDAVSGVPVQVFLGPHACTYVRIGDNVLVFGGRGEFDGYEARLYVPRGHSAAETYARLAREGSAYARLAREGSADTGPRSARSRGGVGFAVQPVTRPAIPFVYRADDRQIEVVGVRLHVPAHAPLRIEVGDNRLVFDAAGVFDRIEPRTPPDPSGLWGRVAAECAARCARGELPEYPYFDLDRAAHRAAELRGWPFGGMGRG